MSQICGLRAVFDITTSDAKGAYTQTDSRGGGGDCLVPKSDTETHLR